MTSLVNDAFAEWTEGLDTRQSMISVFSHIRDIPYSLRISPSNPETSPELLLAAGKGSCGPKHYLLAEMFRKLNLHVVYATIPFLWNDPDLHYPPELRKLAKRLPVAYHLACRVQVGCRWILIDATWDRPLAKAGFPVNDHWDGYSEMRWAVKLLNSDALTAFCHRLTDKPGRGQDKGDPRSPYDEKDHWQLEDRTRFYTEKVGSRTPDEMMRMARFYKEFDEWLVDVRKGEYQR